MVALIIPFSKPKASGLLAASHSSFIICYSGFRHLAVLLHAIIIFSFLNSLLILIKLIYTH